MNSIKEDLSEIILLSKTLGLEVIGTTIHNLKTVYPATYISKAKAKEIMNQLKFAQESGQGEQLLTQQNVPSKIEDVSRFTEVDIPTMTTTAAHGGRIGAFNGGIHFVEKALILEQAKKLILETALGKVFLSNGLCC